MPNLKIWTPVFDSYPENPIILLILIQTFKILRYAQNDRLITTQITMESKTLVLKAMPNLKIWTPVFDSYLENSKILKILV